jgi:hypothetical protein
VFHIKRNTNYYTWTPSLTIRRNQWKYWILAADALLEIGTAVILSVSSLDEHLSQTNTSCLPRFCYQSVHWRITRYFLVRIRIAKSFTNSSKRFRCKVMFDNEHKICSWIHHVRICTAFEQRPSNQGDLDSSVTGEVGRVYYTGVGLLLVSFLYRST